MVEPHLSSCAVHNAPALPPGPCDCGTDPCATVDYRPRLSQRGVAMVYQGEYFIADCGDAPDALDRARAIAVCLNANDRDTAANHIIYACAGCGRLAIDPDADLVRLRAAGGKSCCPERRMLAKSLQGLSGQLNFLNTMNQIIRERAYHLARTTLKPGDKIRVMRCGNSRGAVFTFAGWSGYWIVSKSGVDDLSPCCILTVNGKWVDWSMSSSMWRHLGPGEPFYKREARERAVREGETPTDGEIPF